MVVAGRGLVAPDDVGELSSSFGAASIEHWTLGQGVAQARRWRDLVPGARPFVSCSLSEAALVDRDVDRVVEHALDAYAITPEQVRFSVRAATLQGCDGDQRDALVALRLRGVEVGVSDITSRFLGDASGVEIPSFVVIDVAAASTEIADEAHRRGLDVVVSGVSSEDHARRWVGCSDLLNGPWYSSLVGPEVITAMLRSGRRLIEPADR